MRRCPVAVPGDGRRADCQGDGGHHGELRERPQPGDGPIAVAEGHQDHRQAGRVDGRGQPGHQQRRKRPASLPQQAARTRQPPRQIRMVPGWASKNLSMKWLRGVAALRGQFPKNRPSFPGQFLQRRRAEGGRGKRAAGFIPAVWRPLSIVHCPLSAGTSQASRLGYNGAYGYSFLLPQRA